MGKFKVGDRVRCVEETAILELNKEYTVKAVSEDGVKIFVDLGPLYGVLDYGLHYFEPLPVAAEAQPALKIETGKFYKTRDGRKVGPMALCAWGGFVDESRTITGQRWERNGSFINGQVGKLDLIAEWVDEPAIANDNAAASAAGFTIPLVDEEPANDNKLVVTIALEAVDLVYELDEIIAKLKKIRKLQRKIGIAA